MDSNVKRSIEEAVAAGDVEAFVRAAASVSTEAATRSGFGGARAATTLPLPTDVRQSIVDNRSIRAVSAISELQSWLHDDNPRVRRAARLGIHRCLYAAYTGDQPEPTKGPLGGFLKWLDRQTSRLMKTNIDPDRPMPRARSERGLHLLRTTAIVMAMLLVFTSALLFAIGQVAGALIAAASGATLDVFEGSLARTGHISNARQRWSSCIASHFSDSALLLGVAVGLHAAGMPGEASLLLIATVLSLLGSLTRVSALQAGFRFWRSRIERLVRYGCVGVLGIDMINGQPRTVTALVAISLLLGFTLWEVQRVARAVKHTELHGGGFIFFSSPDDVSCWSFDSEDVAQDGDVLEERPLACR